MTFAGIALLLLALGMTFLYIPVATTIRPVSGPDAMGLIGPIFLSGARALCLAAAIAIAASRGGFAWVHASRGAQWLALTALLAGSVALELWALAAATGSYGVPARAWVTAFAVVSPLAILLLTAAGLDRSGRWDIGTLTIRGAVAALVLLMLIGSAALGWKDREAARHRRAHVAVLEAEAQQVREAKLSAFRALGPGTPLREWLPFTAEPEDELRDAAVAAIRSRPSLDADLAEILRSDEPLPALRWLWLWSHDASATLARPMHDAALGLPEWAKRRYDDADPANDGDVSTACEALVVVVDRFAGLGVDFRPPIEALAAFLASRALPEEQMSYDPTYRARAMLQYWFDRHPPDAAPAR